MDDVTRADSAAALAVDQRAARGLDRRGTPHGLMRRALRGFIHFFSYHLILARRDVRVSYAAGFRLLVRPTVFHPKFFISSERFAEFIDTLDLTGKVVCEVGTGSGILALAAARSGAKLVVEQPREFETEFRGMLRQLELAMREAYFHPSKVPANVMGDEGRAMPQQQQ